MKTSMFAVAIATLFASQLASAADATLATIQARGSAANCSGISYDPACSAFHKEVRRHFSEREIRMLFGARTSVPNYQASYDAVEKRYENFVRDYDERVAAQANGSAVVAAAE